VNGLSKQQIKLKVKKLEDRAKPKDKGPAIGWLEENGKIHCEGQAFDTEEAFQQYTEAQGYSKVFLVKWADKQAPDEAARPQMRRQ
jgi:hypothetical protein